MMTALDQAFIKAYLRRRPSRSRPFPPADPDPSGKGRRERNGNPTASKGSPHGEEASRKSAAMPIDALQIGGAEIASEVVAAIAAAGSPPFEPILAPPTAGQDEANSPIVAASAVLAPPRGQACRANGEPAGDRLDAESPEGNRQSALAGEPGSEAGDCGREPGAEPPRDAEAFQPRLHIDAVAWPEASERLCRVADGQINRVADAVQKAAQSGSRLVGLAGFSLSEGCTTVLLAIAKRLVEVGCKTLLLDADVVNPGLPERLGLKVDFGWREAALGQIALEEVVAESDHENLALLPYCASHTQGAAEIPQDEAIQRVLARLRKHYDLVLADLGSSLTAGGRDGVLAGELAKRMDVVLTVQNVRTTSAPRLAMLRQHIRRLGVAEAGVIENFTEG